MKKLLLTLLLLFALGSSGAWAQTPAYTCLFQKGTASKNVTNYTSSWINTWDNHEWGIANFNNNNINTATGSNYWPFIRCGSSSSASTGSITTNFIVSEKISEVVVVIGSGSKKIANVNSLKLKTSADGTNFTEVVSVASVSIGSMTIAVPGNSQKENLYYRLEFDCKSGQNGACQVDKVELYAAQGGEEPAIYATTGSTTYVAGEEANIVAIGTKVKFSVTNYELVDPSPSATVNGTPATFSDGSFETTINEATTVEITAGEVSATYKFELKPLFTPEGKTWKRVTDTSTFREGDLLIIASASQNVAMSNADNKENTIASIAVTFDDENNYLEFDEVGKTSYPLVLELTAAASSNDIPWALKATNYVGNGNYLSATSDSNHELQVVNDEDDLTIEITDGDALIDFNGHTHHILGYNTSLKVFACYDQTALDGETGDNRYRNADIQIYRLVDEGELRVRYTATAEDGTKYTPWSASDVAAGTTVTFGLQNYSGSPATIKVGDGEAQPLSGNNVITINEDTNVEVTTDVKTVTYVFKVRPAFAIDDKTTVLYYTVAEALSAISDGLTPTLNVKGIVKSITTAVDPKYGNATYVIVDDLSDAQGLTVYRGFGIDGEWFKKEEDLVVGATVVVSGQIFNYVDKNNNETPELSQGNYLIYYFDPNQVEPVKITATSGEGDALVTYPTSFVNRVEKGTKVTITIANCDDADIVALVNDEEATITDGKFTVSIDEATDIEIIAGNEYAEYYFEIVRELTPEGHIWVRVDDAATLNAGDKVIIAATTNDHSVAISNQYSAAVNYLFETSVSVSENTISFEEDGEWQPLVFVLEGSAEEDWNLLTYNSTSIFRGGYLSGSSTDSPLNIVNKTFKDDAKTKIEIDNAHNVFVMWGERFVNYNASTNPRRFASYKSTSNRTPVQLYRLTAVPTLKTEVVVDHNHDKKNGVVTVEFNFGVINHNGDIEHHYVKLYNAEGEIQGLKVTDLKNQRMGAPYRAEGELPDGVQTVSGHFAFEDPEGVNTLKTTDITKIRIESHIGNHNVVNTTYDVANNDIQTGIQEVETEGAEAEYYNLQGLRVSHPVAGQLYIKRQGNRVSKVKF